MNCPVSDEQLWSWVDRDAPELERHLGDCALCRDRAAALRQTIANVNIGTASHVSSIPERIGPYTIERCIGEGGQAIVYQAQELVPPRTVALKVFKNGAAGRNDRLFARELASLQRLRHPLIACIYGAGRCESGSPYLVMEYIAGSSLASQIDRDDLPLRDKLDLFHRICEPVQFAHHHGVIHRDLKPSNILVDDAGNPHVLDFGLARINDADLTLTYTLDGSGRFHGTLPYVSPEQAAGKASEVGPRSDIYSLGVILYEMTTGKLPHEVSRGAPYETIRAIREDEPPRPSSYNAALRGDLETVILKALDKDPSRRYADVAALAGDVRRYLDGRPILARPPGAHDQLKRVLWRHRRPAAFAAALFVIVTVFGIVSALQAARVTRERDLALAAQGKEAQARSIADSEARRARRISEFLEELLFSADPRWTSGEMTVRELLDSAERRLSAASQSDPLAEAELRAIVARTFRRFGIPLRSEPDLPRMLAEIERATEGVSLKRAKAYANLASSTEDVDQAIELFQNALDIRLKLLGPDDPDVLDTMNRLADRRALQGSFAESEKLNRAVLASYRGQGADQAAKAAQSLARVAESLKAQKRFDESIELHQAALHMRRELFGDEHVEVGRSLHQLAVAHYEKGDYASARSRYEAALEVFIALPDQVANQAHVLQRLSVLETSLGRSEAATELIGRAVRLVQPVLPEWHYITILLRRDYAELLVDLDRYPEAELQMEACAGGARDLYGASDAYTLELEDSLRSIRQRDDDIRPTLSHAEKHAAGTAH